MSLKYITAALAAETVGCSELVLRNAAQQGQLHAIVSPYTGNLLYLNEEIETLREAIRYEFMKSVVK